jgi:hypothetical protein
MNIKLYFENPLYVSSQEQPDTLDFILLNPGFLRNRNQTSSVPMGFTIKEIENPQLFPSESELVKI